MTQSRIAGLARSIIVAMTLGLVPGACGGYFSGNWPDISKGFDVPDGPEPASGTEPEPEQEPMVEPGLVGSDIEVVVDAPELAPIVRRHQALIDSVGGQREAFEAAREAASDADDGDGEEGGDATERLRLTTQLELSRLSRLSDGFGDLLAVVGGVREAAMSDGPLADQADSLSARIEVERSELIDYIVAERAKLTQ